MLLAALTSVFKPHCGKTVKIAAGAGRAASHGAKPNPEDKSAGEGVWRLETDCFMWLNLILIFNIRQNEICRFEL